MDEAINAANVVNYLIIEMGLAGRWIPLDSFVAELPEPRRTLPKGIAACLGSSCRAFGGGVCPHPETQSVEPVDGACGRTSGARGWCQMANQRDRSVDKGV